MNTWTDFEVIGTGITTTPDDMLDAEIDNVHRIAQLAPLILRPYLQGDHVGITLPSREQATVVYSYIRVCSPGTVARLVGRIRNQELELRALRAKVKEL